MPDITCSNFGDVVARQTEHLDELMLQDVTPLNTLMGAVRTGNFPAEDGVSHTFDKLNRVQPDMSGAWEDVSIASCVGQPCDPSETKIGMGFTRDSYKLQRKSYATDLFCWDLLLSADKAKQTFTFFVQTLRDATTLINDNRIRNEYLRIAQYKFAVTPTGLTPITFTETGDLINVTPTALPTSGLFVNHLKQRIANQILQGALGKSVQGGPPSIEVLTDMDTIWELLQDDTNIAQAWRFTDFEEGSKEKNTFGWMGRVGNFNVKADLMPIRFQIVGNTLRRVFPYTNVAATEGIKGQVNQDYINAPVQVSFIWHREAMMTRMRDTTSINPMMPFLARDFAGKWQFVMDNLTCGTVTVSGAVVPVAVDNSRRNKGKFIADFSYATQAMFPEYAEAFFHLRAVPCVTGAVPCNINYAYATQSYSSANTPC